MKIDKQKIENSFSKLGEDTKGHIDWIIFIPVVGLLLFSLVFVYSASAPISAEKFEDVGTLFSKHLVRVFLGLITLIVFSKIDYHIYEKLARPIFFVSIAMLVGVLIFGETINGAKRWLEIGPINFQPVEFAKFAMVIYFAYLLTQKQKVIKTFADGFFPFIIWTAIICLLIGLQPNFSNLVLIFIIAMTMLFIGNANLLYLIPTVGVGGILAVLYAVSAQYRIDRIVSFFNLGDISPSVTGYQSQQALIALGNGGIFGLGPGQGRQNHLFLPESYGDFIFSIIGEEYGFVGLVIIFIAFGVIFLRSMLVAKKAPDNFGYFLAIGIVITFALYLVVNAAVNTGLVPTTGVPLPFISYGGTAILIYSAVAGILLNISAQANIYPLETNKK